MIPRREVGCLEVNAADENGRLRRELVNEMLLEPIDGFDQPAVAIPTALGTNPEGLQQHRARIEQGRKQFYTVAADRIAVVAPAVSRAFRKMAE